MYNYLDAFVFMVDTDPATAFAAGAVDDANCKYLGIVKQEAGYKISKDETDKASTGRELVLSWKLELKAEILSSLDETQKQSIDGKTVSLLFLPIDGVTIPDDAVPLTTNLETVGVVLPATPTGKMLAPLTVYIEEDEKYGTGKVAPIVLTGEKSDSNKDELRKTVTITVI